jgi:branched-chain amino acid aminotransferase
MTVYRQTGGKYLPENNDIEYIIQFSEKNHSDYMIDDQLLYEVDLYNDFYISAQLLSTIKTTAKNINVLASIYANENDLDNCILLNERKDVVEFTNGNLFLIFGNKIITPPISSGCLNGIIRKQLIQLLNKSTVFDFEERAISPFELQQADEMFLTNISVGIKPISQYRKKKYQQIKVKEVLEILNNHLVL